MKVVHSFGELGVVIQKEQMQALFEVSPVTIRAYTEVVHTEG